MSILSVASVPLLTFEDEDELSRFLTAHGVDTSGWGSGQAKRVSDLSKEIKSFETRLIVGSDGKVARHLRVVKVAVRDPEIPERVLVEATQILPDGRERRRNILLCEKAMGEEDWQVAAIRGIEEELGSILGKVKDKSVKLLKDTFTEHIVQSDSQSYPTLPTFYTYITVDANVTGLPRDSFETIEPRGDDTFLVSKWEWRSKVP